MDYSSLFDYSVDPSSLVAAAAGGALGWNAVTIQEGMRKSLVHFDDISKFLAANRALHARQDFNFPSSRRVSFRAALEHIFAAQMEAWGQFNVEAVNILGGREDAVHGGKHKTFNSCHGAVLNNRYPIHSFTTLSSA
ncbi:hypothetical protein M8J76_007685 [Diaphorina citri]|nr:hypothetical protein M8J75_015299 [Diaphorina citri]KAI5713912.1 hypothetical protein M8J76_007685 [Diaphorina citri]